tara:strand:+ start:704 stop:1081 length:378 start_codon:yes stop_codon:yes gene_type:complete
MTLLIQETNLTVEFSLNQPSLSLASAYIFTLTSQYSHQPLELDATAIESNERYTTFEVTFPVGFGNSHKNGVYYYDMSVALGTAFEKGLVKIITEPGGGLGTESFDSGIYTEERIADVFFRPNYL